LVPMETLSIRRVFSESSNPARCPMS
jgi:hypothetical protein